MKGKRSCGLDWICGYSLKLASSCLKTEIKYIINLSIRSGTFCNNWKKSKVTPIFKNKGSRYDKTSYRPVSNVSEVSKLCEMAVFDLIYYFFLTKMVSFIGTIMALEKTTQQSQQYNN